MRKIILVLVMLAVAATVWGGATTTITCDECGKEIITSPCYPQDHHIRVTYDPSPVQWDECTGIYAVYSPPPPEDKFFCCEKCMKAHYCEDEDEGPPDGIMLIPGDVIDFSDLNEADLTMPYTPGIDAKDITK